MVRLSLTRPLDIHLVILFNACLNCAKFLFIGLQTTVAVYGGLGDTFVSLLSTLTEVSTGKFPAAGVFYRLLIVL